MTSEQLPRWFRFFSPVFWLEIIYSAFIKARLGGHGKSTRFRLCATLRGHENIHLGDHFHSGKHLYMYAHNNGYLQLGNNCSVNSNVQLGAANGKIIMGNNILIASNVVLRAADHGVARNELIVSQAHESGEIVIEDDVWIGANAVVTTNVTLRKGTVVGAGAVVTSSTEPYSIVAGVPARKIGERV